MQRLLLIATLAGACCFAAPAHAKSFHYPSLEVQAEVKADGSMHMRESREYAFDGNFHEAWRKIPLPPQTAIRNFRVLEDGQPYREEASKQPGTYYLERSGLEFAAYWYYDIADRTVTFALDYDVAGAVEGHADYAQLYWKFVEPDRGTRADHVRVTVALPGVAKGDIRAWAHGPLWGETVIEDGRVVFTCDPLPDREILEARILFPRAAITSATKQYPDTIEPTVLAEEASWADEANRARTKARVVLFLPLIAAIAGALVWLILYLRYGVEHQEADPPEYLREPLEGWKPNDAGYLWKWGSLGPTDMTATLMDLVRRGALRLVVQEEEHPRLGGLLSTRRDEEQYVEKVSGFAGDLSESERYLIDRILFHGRRSSARVSMDEFKETARKDPVSARARYEHWRTAAGRESQRVPLDDPRSKVAMGFGIALGAGLFVSVFVLGPALQSPTAFVPAVVGFALIPASLAIRRRTREAAVALHRWQAFRRYLTDFSHLKDYPAPAVALWEHYLVFAITLGVAERVIEQFKELHAMMVREGHAADMTTTFPNWVSHTGSPFATMDSISSAFSSFSSTFATATSSFSSSSGGGGGFSSGGGGGGGGGSSGAR